MLLNNLVVRHKSFGEGIVTSSDSKYITVKFSNTEKKFVYPDIFEKFLTLEDGTVSEEILQDLDASKMKKQEVINKKQEENLRAMTKGIVIPGKYNPQGTSPESEREQNHEEEI